MASRLSARLWVLGRLLSCGWRRKSPSPVPARILVLHHLLLGDTLMLTPLRARLRERWSEAEVFLACPRAFLPLYACRPYGVQALEFDPRRVETLKGLPAQGPFDLCLIPAENRYTPLARALGASVVRGFEGDQPAWKNWLLDEARPFPQSPACFGDFAAGLVDELAPRPFRPEDWAWAECKPFPRPASPYAVLHLGASTPLKYWPAGRWFALAEALSALGITPVWSAGAKETALVEAVDPDGRFTNFAGRLDLLQMAHLLKGARLMVCPDTGITHLGRLTGTPTVALFGPGSPEICGAGEFWRESPFEALSVPVPCRDQDVTFRRHADWIRRCARRFGEGPGQCANPRCMEGIGLESVLAACRKFLAN